MPSGQPLRATIGAALALGWSALIIVSAGMPAARASGAQLDPGHRPASVSTIDRSYAGSSVCQSCHESEYGAWKRSLHVQMTRPIAEARIEGDFTPGTRLDQYGRTSTMEARGGRYFIAVSRRGQPASKFEISYTLGARRFQGYLSRLPDGRIYVLPVFWHVQTRRWIDWKEIVPVPDTDHDLRQIWNVDCFNCHATNLVVNFDVSTKAYSTTWTEMGIGCEACHGPGKAHVDLMQTWAANPAARPAYDSSSRNRGLGSLLKVFSPRTAERRQVFDLCAYCHGNKNNIFTGFVPGDRLEDYAIPFLISQPIPDNDPQGDFWPDGRPTRFNRSQALMLSGCFQKGQAVCTTCHSAHGSRNDPALKVPIEHSNPLCTQCHKTFVASETDATDGDKDEKSDQVNRRLRSFEGAELVLHTHHSPDSKGSRCVECHMSNVNWRMLNRWRDHTFAAPVPEMTARYGVPNACTTCHDNRTPEWAASVMDQWYRDGDRRRKKLRVADVIYEAGAGNVSALPQLASLAVDRRQGAILRASAADFIGRLMVKATEQHAAAAGAEPDSIAANPPARMVNALIAAAADPEPIVRIAAVRALGLIGDRRAVPPLVARLVDRARIARTTAAESLLHMGIVSLAGLPGTALARAQEEYAQGLRTFADVGGDQASLAWLELSRGRPADAERALENAIGLDPTDARPHVLRGVMAARAGRFDQALNEWRTAKTLDPRYPNIDRLIEEAQKLRKQR